MLRIPRPAAGMVELVTLLALLALTPGCNTPAPEQFEVVIATRGMPLTLMPHARSEALTSSFQSNLFEGLVGFDRDLKPIPLLAVSWENPDPLNWLFRLRRGVSFHNGDPLTADDVVFSILRARDDPASALRSNCAVIAAVTREDEYTVRVTTIHPHPMLLQKLRTVFILPRRHLERVGEAAFIRQPVGTGPYRLVAATPAEIRLAVYEGHWGDAPDFTAARFIRFQSDEEAEALLRGGRTDLAANISPATAASLAARPAAGMDVIRNRSLMVLTFGLDTRAQPFRDVRVRRALALAVDRAALVAKLRFGYGSPANQLVPPAVFGYNPELAELPYHPEGARELLAAAGHTDGLELTLLLPQSRIPFAEELRRQMAPAGIRLRPDPRERESYWTMADTAPFFLQGIASTTGDASDVFDDMIHSTTEFYGRDNHSRFGIPAIDQFIEGLNDFWVRRPRLLALQRTMALVMAEMPRVPLIVEDTIYARSTRIDSLPRVDNYVLIHEIRRRR